MQDLNKTKIAVFIKFTPASRSGFGAAHRRLDPFPDPEAAALAVYMNHAGNHIKPDAVICLNQADFTAALCALRGFLSLYTSTAIRPHIAISTSHIMNWVRGPVKK